MAFLSAKVVLVPLHRGFDGLLVAVRQRNYGLFQSLTVLPQHGLPVETTVQRN